MGSSTKRSVNASSMKGPDRAYQRCLARDVDCYKPKIISHFVKDHEIKSSVHCRKKILNHFNNSIDSKLAKSQH